MKIFALMIATLLAGGSAMAATGPDAKVNCKEVINQVKKKKNEQNSTESSSDVKKDGKEKPVE